MHSFLANVYSDSFHYNFLIEHTLRQYNPMKHSLQLKVSKKSWQGRSLLQDTMGTPVLDNNCSAGHPNWTFCPEHLSTWEHCALRHLSTLSSWGLVNTVQLSTWALWAVEERNFYKLTANNTGWVGDGALELALSPGILVDLGIVISEGIVLKSEGLFCVLSFNWSGAVTEFLDVLI